MKKLLLYITTIIFVISSISWSDDNAKDAFKEEIQKLNSKKYNRRHVGNGTSSTFYLRYSKDKMELKRFQNIISNPLSNDKRLLNKWSKGTFHVIEKKEYGKTYDDYNVFFGNEAVLFKNRNFLMEGSVYIMTQKPYSTFQCTDGIPSFGDFKYSPDYRHWGFVKVDELVDETFHTFPYFDDDEPSVAIAFGQGVLTGTGTGVFYFLIFSTTSNKYHVSESYGCGEIPPDIPSIAVDDWKDIYATGQRSCENVLEYCGYNFYNVICEEQTSYVQGMITAFNMKRQNYIGEKAATNHSQIKMGLIHYCKKYPHKDTIDAGIHIYNLLVNEICGEDILCLGE